jgi:hypothetical protein
VGLFDEKTRGLKSLDTVPLIGLRTKFTDFSIKNVAKAFCLRQFFRTHSVMKFFKSEPNLAVDLLFRQKKFAFVPESGSVFRPSIIFSLWLVIYFLSITYNSIEAF